MIDNSLRKAAFLALSLSFSACTTIKQSVADLHMPKMPDLSGMKKILPGSNDSPAADDPLIPFSATGKLAKGHTLRLRLYEGAMNAREIFSGLAMVDEQGVAKIGKIGSAKIGGRTLPEAVSMIESVCRVGGHAASRIHVQVISVEDVQLIAVTGNVKMQQHLPFAEGMRFSSAVMQCGGPKITQGSAVYVTRGGERKFFSNISAADAWDSAHAGDIITLSSDL